MHKFKLTLTVGVDLNGTDPDEIRANLDRLAEAALANGGFTGDTEAELAGCEWEVKPLPPVVRLKFRPQAWIRDHAFDADPQGLATWETPLAGFLDRFPTPEDWEDDYARDEMRSEPEAPRWVHNWDGPFEVELAQGENPWKA